MMYRISYIDAPSSPTRERRMAERTEYYTSLAAALAKARELLERVDCHMVLISGGPDFRRCARANRRGMSSAWGRLH